MAAPGPQGAEERAWSPCCPPRRAKQGQGRHVVAGQPAGRSCARTPSTGDQTRTFDPPHAAARSRGPLVELCRLVPVMVHGRCSALGVLSRCRRSTPGSAWWRPRCSAARAPGRAARSRPGSATVAKWLLVGRHRARSSIRCGARSSGATSGRHASSRWSRRRGSPRAAAGTPVLNVWLRALGAQIGRGVWCETYWLPEADLVDAAATGATVNRGCVVQTHLFHDRIMSMDTVTLADRGDARAALRRSCRPRLGRHATVGPVSLVMRGESCRPARAGSATRSAPGSTPSTCSP